MCLAVIEKVRATVDIITYTSFQELLNLFSLMLEMTSFHEKETQNLVFEKVNDKNKLFITSCIIDAGG